MANVLSGRPLAPFGFEVDWDLREPLTTELAQGLRELFDRHHVLVFRNQTITGEDQIRTSGLVGPVLYDSPDGFSFLAKDPAVGALGVSALAFHSDLACTPDPFIALSLFAVDVHDGETSTLFANGVAAAAALPPDLRTRLDGLQALHLWPQSLSQRQRRADSPPDWPGTAHPVVMRHARTGRAVLYVNAQQTDSILSLDPQESEALIQTLFDHLYDKGNIYEHRWRNGDFVLWDNIALQHGRAALDATQGPRTMRRVEVATRGIMDLMPPELLAYYETGGLDAAM